MDHPKLVKINDKVSFVVDQWIITNEDKQHIFKNESDFKNAFREIQKIKHTSEIGYKIEKIEGKSILKPFARRTDGQ